MDTYIHSGIMAGKLKGVIPAVTPKEANIQFTQVRHYVVKRDAQMKDNYREEACRNKCPCP